mmetsp:Transcript_36423/g.70263  ORF Transcript_36423/g.70263 Transcript_36423/m.70263 type:complete len:149 (+) Transcript_36423:259-705(+)
MLHQSGERREKKKIAIFGHGGNTTVYRQFLAIGRAKSSIPGDKAKQYHTMLVDNCICAMELLIAATPLISRTEMSREHFDLVQSHNRFRTAVDKKKMADAIQRLWNNEHIQSAYASTSKLPPSTTYLMNRFSDFCRENYVPSFDDIIR